MILSTKTESNLNKMLRATICVFVLCNLRSSVFSQLLPDDDTVDLVQGTLRGSSRILDGRRVYYFLGIPYAEPPLSNRRFRPSSPHNGWTVNNLMFLRLNGYAEIKLTRESKSDMNENTATIYYNVASEQCYMFTSSSFIGNLVVRTAYHI